MVRNDYDNSVGLYGATISVAACRCHLYGYWFSPFVARQITWEVKDMYNKAIAALVVGGLAIVLKQFGLTPDSTIADVVAAIITAGSVWFIANRKA